MAGFGFRKRDRRLSAREYDRVFKTARYRVGSREFLMLAAVNDQNVSRIGTVVSKKVAGNAVERNRIRRLIKETFRLTRPDPGLDIVVVARPPSRGEDNRALTGALNRMWQTLATKRSARE